MNETFTIYIFMLYFILKNIKYNALKYKKNEMIRHLKLFIVFGSIELLIVLFTYFVFSDTTMMITLTVINGGMLLFYLFTSFSVFSYFFSDLNKDDNKGLMAEMTYKRDINTITNLFVISLLSYFFQENIEILYFIIVLKFLFYFKYSHNLMLLNENIYNSNDIYENNLKRSIYL